MAASTHGIPWTITTFRHKKFRSHRDSKSLSRKQKRAEFKSVQKLVDFETQRKYKHAAHSSELPTPRQYFAPKRRFDNSKFNFVNMALDESEEEKIVWESRGLKSWNTYMDMYLNRKLDIVSPEDVRNVFKYKKKKNIVEEVLPLTLDDLLKESKKINETTPDSGLGKDVEISDPITIEQVKEELSDMDIIMSDNENQDDNSSTIKNSASEQPETLKDCEDILSDEEWN